MNTPRGKAWAKRQKSKRFRRISKTRDVGSRVGTKRLANHYWGDGPTQQNYPRKDEDQEGNDS